LGDEEQQSPVPSALPSCWVRRGGEDIDFLVGEERDDWLVESLGGDGQHALDEPDVLGVAQGGVGEQ
jgi:hypothetical protein